MGDTTNEERRLRQLMDAALPALMDLIAEYRRGGGDAAAVAGFVYDAEAARAGGRERGEVALMPREKALEIARGVAPDYAHLLEGRAQDGAFHVVALVGELGAVVALSLPAAAAPPSPH